MSKKQKRTREENIAAIKRSIRKFGDSDGSRKSILLKLKREETK